MKQLGKHLLIELYGCDNQKIDDLIFVKKTLIQSAKISGAHIVKTFFHKFSPQGVSGIIVISESHFSIHTWPEHGYCALDIFTCGKNIDSDKALDFLKKKFESHDFLLKKIRRGLQ